MAELFGPNVRNILASDPPVLPNEKELLDALVEKVGLFADKHKLLHHIRVSAGKIHWAVNSYFRSILAVARPPNNREDFDSKPSCSWQLSAQQSAADAGPTSTAQLASTGATTAGAAAAAGGCLLSTVNQQQAQASKDAVDAVEVPATAHGAADASPAQVSLDGLPTNILDSIMLHLDVEAVLCAASSCKALYRAAQADRVWQNLFRQQWGSVIFPTSKHTSSSDVPGSRRHDQTTTFASEQQASSSSPNSAVGAAETAEGSGSAAQVEGDQAAVTLPTVVASSQQAAAAASCNSPGLPRVPLFEAALGEASATALLGTTSSGSTPGLTEAAAVQAVPPLLRQPLAASAPTTAERGTGSSSSRRSFVQRWTGSCLPSKCGTAATPASPAGATTSTQHSQSLGSSGSCTCTCHKQQQHHQQQRIHCQRLCCGSCCAMLPQRAPAGSWKAQYKQQYSYQAVRRCPKCGDAFIVPIVYGFPSAPLLAGMNSKRLVLGGDHLIEACHVWACSGCRSCYRFFPYTAVHLWLQDDEAQQRSDQARAAAGRGSRRHSAANGDLQAGGQLQLPGDDEAAAAGMPRYTYEL